MRAAIVLAAGKGKRMKSDRPKVLHTINDRPMICILLDTLVDVGFDIIVVVIGHKGDQVKAALEGYPVEFVWQLEQKGTGDAVKHAQELLGAFEGTTLVAAGDVPFLSAKSIETLFDRHEKDRAAATCLSAVPDNPKQYGRIIRDNDSDRLKAIVEYKDASEDIRAIGEINTGTFCFDNQILFNALEGVRDNNAQGEYYLTDVVKILHERNLTVSVVQAQDANEVEGINSAEELANLANVFGYRS